jgi:hypothetical protein
MRTHSRACRLSVTPGNNRRSSMTAESSPRWWKASRNAVASTLVTENMAGGWACVGRQRNAAKPAPRKSASPPGTRGSVPCDSSAQGSKKDCYGSGGTVGAAWQLDRASALGLLSARGCCNRNRARANPNWDRRIMATFSAERAMTCVRTRRRRQLTFAAWAEPRSAI